MIKPNRLINMNKSKLVRELDKETLQKIVDNSFSITEVAKKLELNTNSSGLMNLLRIRIQTLGIDLSPLKTRLKTWRSEKSMAFFQGIKVSNNDIMTIDSKHHRSSVKRRLIVDKLIDNQCEICGLKDVWQGKPITLSLDHKNGINNDNRIENLRFLCPNCHSQTTTFSGRNIVREIKVKNKTGRPRKFYCSKEKLSDLISKTPMVHIAKMFGVTDNAIRKRCEEYGIKTKGRGGWQKEGIARSDSIPQISSEEINKVIEENNGNILASSKKLNVDRKKLIRWIRFYEISAHCGVGESGRPRRPHKPEIAGPNPASATTMETLG